MAKYNRVPDGRVGTGEAYILPESRALNGLLQSIESNRKLGLLNVQAKNAQQSQTNKDFMDNQLKVKSGILFQDDLNNATQQWVDKGAKYRAEGFNPFNPNPSNPKEVEAASEFLKEKGMIEGMADTRDIYQKNFLEQQGQYEKGGVDEDSWSAMQDFYKTNNLADLYNNGVTPPTLMKAFDTQNFMKDIAAPTIKSNSIVDNLETTTVAANRAAIRDNVEQGISQNPQAQRWFRKQFGVNESEAPAKMILGTTDPKQLDDYLSKYYQSPDGVAEALKAFPSGTVPSYNSPEFAKFKNEAIQRQLRQENAYERGMQTLSQQKENEVNTSNEKKYNFDLENQGMKREDQRQQRTRFGWAAEDQGNKRKDRKFAEDSLNKRDEFIQGLQVGNREQVQNLRQLVRPRGGSVAFLPDGKMRVTFNQQVGTEIQKMTKDIDMSEVNDNGYVELNQILNRVADKVVPIETLQAKPTYKGGLVDIGDVSVTGDQMKFLREQFKGSPKDLGDFLIEQGGFSTRTEAYKKAAEILDPKGRVHTIKQKQK